ncbi:HNH endonuclease signature motif containing protein [Nocardioides jejuensis]|uniref:HNH endonuclease n=1 Tax=Nocardioides jejuensis TaxID=2502782 RepID=A0A4R1CI62_9ACTN|nr:HNH endonuclease signature motif containing protein [Nocardioides jejuensis]TCJ30447.1 HNH endonuclease [Nocardioides jejuensis]
MDYFSGSGHEAPLVAAAHALDEQLKAVAGNDPTFLSVLEKEDLLLTLVHVKRSVEGLLVDTLAVAGDVADEHGARSAGAWLAAASQESAAVVGSLQRLAVDGARFPEVVSALRAGRMSVAHADVVLRAVDALGGDVSQEVRAEATEHLVGAATDFSPKELRRLGDGVLAAIDPEAFEDAERAKLEAELDKARAASRLTLRSAGDGVTRVSGVLPDSVAARLRTYLESFSAPRHDAASGAATGAAETPSRYLDPVTGRRLTHERVLGEAFAAMLECLDVGRLPVHGGDATQVVVTIDWKDLLAGTGVAMAGGEALPVGQIRRLACQAGVLPAVLGGRSEVLDLGRSRRLFSKAQRRAMGLRQSSCAFEGCDVPGRWCEAHHLDPWSAGGQTDLARGVLICPRHHHVVHDERYVVSRLPGGAMSAVLQR